MAEEAVNMPIGRARTIWTKPAHTRGKLVEAKFGGSNLPNCHPVIDQMDWATGNAISIKSIDTNLPSYKGNSSAISSTLKRYINDLEAFNGSKVVDLDKVKSRTLQLAIPKGAAADQSVQRALEKATNHAKNKNINIKVTEID